MSHITSCEFSPAISRHEEHEKYIGERVKALITLSLFWVLVILNHLMF